MHLLKIGGNLLRKRLPGGGGGGGERGRGRKRKREKKKKEKKKKKKKKKKKQQQTPPISSCKSLGFSLSIRVFLFLSKIAIYYCCYY